MKRVFSFYSAIAGCLVVQNNRTYIAINERDVYSNRGIRFRIPNGSNPLIIVELDVRAVLDFVVFKCDVVLEY
jgi:hypothetical protein